MKWKLAESCTFGRGRRTMASIQEKIVVFAPMPMPSDNTITAASTGILAIIRQA